MTFKTQGESEQRNLFLCVLQAYKYTTTPQMAHTQ